ncbi:MAG: alkaline phosphatase family protein [Candidatus Kerfeldbacteria bacterium]|nr:alkaline phosphatase family protein [Candidatus Kerfeldbacteria bacterium]
MIVIGVDGAGWDVINANEPRLPTFTRLKRTWTASTMHLEQKPWSASVWCSMFSGKTPEEHGHRDFVKDGKIQTRDDVRVDFIWDQMHRVGTSVVALNVPFIVPPYSFNIRYIGPGGGVPISREEMRAEIAEVADRIRTVKETQNPDLLIACFTAIDKISHQEWGEHVVAEYYEQMDRALAPLVELDPEMLIISDHGFCDYDAAPIQTLPKVTSTGRTLKGDHHPDAIVLRHNIDFPIAQPMDVYHGLAKRFLG